MADVKSLIKLWEGRGAADTAKQGSDVLREPNSDPLVDPLAGNVAKGNQATEKLASSETDLLDLEKPTREMNAGFMEDYDNRGAQVGGEKVAFDDFALRSMVGQQAAMKGAALQRKNLDRANLLDRSEKGVGVDEKALLGSGTFSEQMAQKNELLAMLDQEKGG